jgi:hypothetical protein
MTGNNNMEPSRFIKEAGLVLKSLTPGSLDTTMPSPAGDQANEDTE